MIHIRKIGAKSQDWRDAYIVLNPSLSRDANSDWFGDYRSGSLSDPCGTHEERLLEILTKSVEFYSSRNSTHLPQGLTLNIFFMHNEDFKRTIEPHNFPAKSTLFSSINRKFLLNNGANRYMWSTFFRADASNLRMVYIVYGAVWQARDGWLVLCLLSELPFVSYR